MKKSGTWVSVISILAIAAGLLSFYVFRPPSVSPVNTAPTNANSSTTVNTNQNESAPKNSNQGTTSDSEVVLPISQFFSRITKKPFGIYIDPASSPVKPERFRGYHAGSDAETTPAEAKIDIPVLAIADGELVYAGWTSGYGGVVMIKHVVGNETVTALYGHLRISSVGKSVGKTVRRGEKIGVLGTGGTRETDGERKHLHFAILKGPSTSRRGYVSVESRLKSWYDPVAWLIDHGAPRS